jgi:hypothetical protein
MQGGALDRQAIGRIVGNLNRVVLVAVGEDRNRRPEDFHAPLRSQSAFLLQPHPDFVDPLLTRR